MKALMLATAMTLAAAPAFAQTGQQCGPTESGHQNLRAKYSEVAIFKGASFRGYTLSLWVNLDTGTFTVLRDQPDGVSCVLDAGEGFEIPTVAPIRGVGPEMEG